MTAHREDPQVPPRPRPGHGTVFVMRMALNEWTASWHDAEHEAVSEIWGIDVEVLAWARAQPAADKLVFDWDLDSYRPLPETGAVDVGSAWPAPDTRTG